MAITQERLISVISALRRAYDTSNLLKRQIRATATTLTSTSTLDDYREAIQSLQFLAEQPFISESDLSLLVAEEQHFRNSFKKNQRTAAYARRKRAGLPSGLSFTGGNAPGSVTTIPNISDEEKYAHYEQAERAISAGLAAPDQLSALKGKNAPTSPHDLQLKKPLELYTTKKPLRSAGIELSTSEMAAKGWISQLSKDKMNLDAARKAVNIPPIYADYTDDSQPLTQDDQIQLGYLNPADINGELF
jgi:hypothetical protein